MSKFAVQARSVCSIFQIIVHEKSYYTTIIMLCDRGM